jgi:LuxR family maltose regulon positive regulatory protein
MTVLSWLEALPDEAARSWPRLCVATAWVLVRAGRLDDVGQRGHGAEEALSRLKEEADLLQVAGHVATLRTYAAALGGDLPHAVQFARQALALLPEGERMTRGLIATILASALRWDGQLDAARRATLEAIAICEEAQETNLLVDALCDLAVLQRVQGQLQLSAETCRSALVLVEGSLAPGGRPAHGRGRAQIQLGAVLREWNRLEEARRYTLEGLELCPPWGRKEDLVDLYLESARVFQACGDVARAEEAIRGSRRAARDLPPHYAARVAAWEARIRLGEGDVAAATRWAETSGMTVDDAVGFPEYELYLALAETCVAEAGQHPGRSLQDGLRLLDRLEELAEAVGATGYAIETMALQAVALEANGQAERALAVLERLLQRARPPGYTRVFLDRGAGMRKLLRRAAARGVLLHHVRDLVVTLERELASRAETQAAPAPVALEDPLTERETEVLQLLVSDLSSRGMAEELFISVNTLRSHLRSIYGKLGVHSRYQAVARAKELGLL